LSLVVVLPLVLGKFSEGDAALWLVFSSMVVLQNLLAAGFLPNFARLFAYACGGGEVDRMRDLRAGTSIRDATIEGINWDSVARIASMSRRIFLVLGVISALLMLGLGTLALQKPVSLSSSPPQAWIAWAIIVLTTAASLSSSTYSCYLQGMNHITLQRRWEAVTYLGAIVSSLVVLLFNGGLLALIIANQSWSLVLIWQYRRLCHQVDSGRFTSLERTGWDRTAFAVLWPNAWKTGVATIATSGFAQATGVIQAQTEDSVRLASYILSLRLVTVIAQVAQAPFLTKLPEGARQRAAGNLVGQLRILQRGMTLSHWLLVLGLSATGFALPTLLTWIDSRAAQFDPLLWGLLAVNAFLERWGGMLHHSRNLTNRSIEHVGALGYCLLSLVIVVVGHARLGIYVFPVAMLSTQLLFSMWLAARVGYPALHTRFMAFEKRVAVPPMLALIFLMATMSLWVWNPTR